MCNLLTDTHCHLNLELFNNDREVVLERASQVGVERILIPGLSIPSSLSAFHLAETHPNLFAAIGIHPTELGTIKSDSLERLFKLANEITAVSPRSKIVAIGEIGLDYYWDSRQHEIQKDVLKDQLAMAADLRMPVIIHFREQGNASEGDCASDLLIILEEWEAGLKNMNSPLIGKSGVFHSFSGNIKTARAAIDLGFFIGISGPITYDSGHQRIKLIKEIGLGKILIETDSPFQTPFPLRGKRNEPAYVRLIADKIAFVYGITTEKVAYATSENANRLFTWE
jgi:TatD DNase family protein